MLLALFVVRTINLREIANVFTSDAEVNSRYKRCNRFFAGFKIHFNLISKWIFRLFFSDSQKFYLTIYRANWYWDKAKINILILAIAYEGIAIPIFWNLLNKAGNATAQEHRYIIECFISMF